VVAISRRVFLFLSSSNQMIYFCICPVRCIPTSSHCTTSWTILRIPHITHLPFASTHIHHCLPTPIVFGQSAACIFGFGIIDSIAYHPAYFSLALAVLYRYYCFCCIALHIV
jgi:hypothetical protein